MTPSKPAVVEALRLELERQYGRVVAAAAESHGYATDQDSRAESKYDTRSLEASYLAMGQASKADELAEALRSCDMSHFPPFSETDLAGVGALVELRYEEGERCYFLLARHGGGEILTVSGVSVMVVTAGAPLFQAVQGRRVGDRTVQPATEVTGVW